VHALAESLLAQRGGLKELVRMTPAELCTLPGLGLARASRVLAALELGRRVQRGGDARPRIFTPADAYQHLRPSLTALRREVFHVLCLNARNVLLQDARVAEGSTNACPVDPREVFQVALAARATAVILAHNHPSGDPEPSAEDRALTAQLVEGGRLLGIKVLDHLVIGDGRYCSLSERREMPGGAPSPARGAWGSKALTPKAES
jgi:DNA repair protein RadC